MPSEVGVGLHRVLSARSRKTQCQDPVPIVPERILQQ